LNSEEKIATTSEKTTQSREQKYVKVRVCRSQTFIQIVRREEEEGRER
jgi:hypothetical protein